MKTLPISLYGASVLRKVAKKIDKDFNGLPELIEQMYQTMAKADGMGLAAPQVGKSLRLFVVDATPLADEDPSLKDFKQVFINPEIIEKSGTNVSLDEGCLSIPNIREYVIRKSNVKVRYHDENFELHEEELEGLKARVFQHEFDHLQGILFVDKISPIKKRLLKGKLAAIAKGKVKPKYLVSKTR